MQFFDICVVSAALCVAVSVVNSVSLFKKKDKQIDCFDDVEQAAFTIAQEICIGEAIKNQTPIPEGTKADDTDEVAPAEAILQEQLLAFYSDSDSTDIPPDPVKSKFEDCFNVIAPAQISMKPGKFAKKYDVDVSKTLLQLNSKKCQPSSNVEDLLSPAYIEKVQQRWENSGTLRRTFNKLIAKLFGAANKEYVKCFDKVLNATLPEMLCVDEKNRALILAKCLDGNTLPGLTDDKTAKGKDGTVKLERLGWISRFLIDNFLCLQPKLRQGVKGACNIFTAWPVHAFLGVAIGPIVIFFWVWGKSFLKCGVPAFCIGWIPGGIFAICWLVGYLFFTLFRIPWKIFWQIAEKANDHDDYGWKKATEHLKKRAKEFADSYYKE